MPVHRGKCVEYQVPVFRFDRNHRTHCDQSRLCRGHGSDLTLDLKSLGDR